MEVDITRKDLETTQQELKESFSTFITKWRAKAAQMMSRLSEEEQDTLTLPKPIYGIDSEKEPLTLDGFEIEKPSFEKREEGIEKIQMYFTSYEEEEYWEACYHTLKSLYELRANEKDKEGGTAQSDDEMEVKTRVIVAVTAAAITVDMMMMTTTPIVTTTPGVMIARIVNMIGVNPLVIEKTKMQIYSMKNIMMMWTTMVKILKMMLKLTDWTDITNVSSRSGPRYDKHGREVSELGSYDHSKPSSPTPHTEEEDDIDARLAALDQKLMVHNLRIITLENGEWNKERMEKSESKHLPQPIYLGNRGKHDLFDEWMDSIECLDAFMTD
ncbi:hypothetical protein SO802_012818 [Lithocarpus litseifolius]|uniref:Uncharacterized protein n=1 Tax=Lithocarpus litseifolius TaxID=425828 RepID=A0AAW2D3U8_9ROSI